jgi:hypothetical protein
MANNQISKMNINPAINIIAPFILYKEIMPRMIPSCILRVKGKPGKIILTFSKEKWLGGLTTP